MLKTKRFLNSRKLHPLLLMRLCFCVLGLAHSQFVAISQEITGQNGDVKATRITSESPLSSELDDVLFRQANREMYGRTGVMSAAMLSIVNPNDDNQVDESLILIGRSLVSVGQTHAAEFVFEEAARRVKARAGSESSEFKGSLIQLSTLYSLSGLSRKAMLVNKAILETEWLELEEKVTQVQLLHKCYLTSIYLGDLKTAASLAQKLCNENAGSDRIGRLFTLRKELLNNMGLSSEAIAEDDVIENYTDSSSVDIKYIIGLKYFELGNFDRASKFFRSIINTKPTYGRLFPFDVSLKKKLPSEANLDRVKEFQVESLRIRATVLLHACKLKASKSTRLADESIARLRKELEDQKEGQPQGVGDYLDFEAADSLAHAGLTKEAVEFGKSWLNSASATANPRFAVYHKVLQAECALQEGRFQECIGFVNGILDVGIFVDLSVADRAYLSLLQQFAALKQDHSRTGGAAPLATIDFPSKLRLDQGNIPGFHGRVLHLLYGAQLAFRKIGNDVKAEEFENLCDDYGDRWGGNFSKSKSTRYRFSDSGEALENDN